MKARTSALIAFALCVILAAAAVVIFVSRGAEKKAEDSVSIPPRPEGYAFPAEETPAAAAAEPDKAPETDAPEPAAETPEPTPTPTSEPVGPLVPEQPVPAPEDYFRDAAFVGNSLVTGLDMYDYDDVLAGADFYAANSVTVLGVSDYIRQMEGHAYGKVYIGLGTNEMSYDKGELRRCYVDTINTLRGYNPDCIIYLMSVTPVSRYKSENNTMFTKLLVLEFNQMLYEIAGEEGVWYLDQYSVLCDEDGYLPSDVTVDGVHFTPAHYEYWFDYLQTHYVPTDGAVYAPEADSTDSLSA